MRKLSASSNTNTPTGDAARTVAVCGRFEQHRHLAENRARLADHGDLGIASQHLDAPLGQDVQPSRGFALGR